MTAAQLLQHLKRTALGHLPLEKQLALIEAHQLIDTPPRSTLYLEEDAPRITLLLSGIVRVWIASADGREMTIRYVKAGEFVGIPTFLVGPVPVRATTMTACRLCFLKADTVLKLAEADGQIALALGRECAFNLFDLIERTRSAAFANVRQKVARDLLDLGTEQDGAIRVGVSTAEIAAAVGSVREVVSRVLKSFRSEGLVETGRCEIILRNLAGLRAVVLGTETPTASDVSH